MARSALASEDKSFEGTFLGAVGGQFRSLQKLHLVLKIFRESSKPQLRCQEGCHNVSFQLSLKIFTGDREEFMEVRLKWRAERMEIFLWSSKYNMNTQMLESFFPHKPARIGALQPMCCLWWLRSAFLRALICSTDGCRRAFPAYGESYKAMTPVLKCLLLLCLHKSCSYLFMNVALRTGTARSAIAVYLQHVAAMLWSTH